MARRFWLWFWSALLVSLGLCVHSVPIFKRGHFLGKKDYSSFPNSDMDDNDIDSDLMEDIQRLKDGALLQELLRYLPPLVEHKTWERANNYKAASYILQHLSEMRQSPE